MSKGIILCEAESASHNQIYGANAAPFMRIQKQDSHKLYYKCNIYKLQGRSWKKECFSGRVIQ